LQVLGYSSINSEILFPFCWWHNLAAAGTDLLLTFDSVNVRPARSRTISSQLQKPNMLYPFSELAVRIISLFIVSAVAHRLLRCFYFINFCRGLCGWNREYYEVLV